MTLFSKLMLNIGAETKKNVCSYCGFNKKRVSLRQVFLVVNLVLVFKPWVM